MSASTRAVLDHHLACVAQGDIDGILEDYTEDSVLMTPDGPLEGLGPIRKLFELVVGEMLPPGTQLDLKQTTVHGEVAYIAWTAQTDAMDFPLGTDTFVVRDGKILVQTFAAHVVPR